MQEDHHGYMAPSDGDAGEAEIEEHEGGTAACAGVRGQLAMVGGGVRASVR